LVEIAGYPDADTIHLVMDNLSSHNCKALVDRFSEKIGGLLWERFTVQRLALDSAEVDDECGWSLFSRHGPAPEKRTAGEMNGIGRKLRTRGERLDGKS
jgi:hypothetical protein